MVTGNDIFKAFERRYFPTLTIFSDLQLSDGGRTSPRPLTHITLRCSFVAGNGGVGTE